MPKERLAHGGRPRRKYYHLTDKGRRQFAEKKAEFLSYTRDVTRVLEFA